MVVWGYGIRVAISLESQYLASSLDSWGLLAILRLSCELRIKKEGLFTRVLVSGELGDLESSPLSLDSEPQSAL